MTEMETGIIYERVAAILNGVDQDTMAIMRRYAGADFHVARVGEYEVCDILGYHDQEWTASDFVEMITRAESSVDPQWRESIRVRAERDYEYGHKLSMFCVRPESEAEVLDRVNRAITHARNEQMRERATYEALRRKFG